MHFCSSIVVADHISDDMVMSVPLEVNPSDVCVSAALYHCVTKCMENQTLSTIS